MWPGRKLLGIIKKGKDDEYILYVVRAETRDSIQCVKIAAVMRVAEEALQQRS
jgi:hypothetical protein